MIDLSVRVSKKIMLYIRPRTGNVRTAAFL